MTGNTERIYDTEPLTTDFEAKVISCRENSDGLYNTVLDRTAFFATGGGQMCDTGTIDGAEVREVKNSGDGIIHITSKKIDAGSSVFCQVDREQRISRMETHTGEHIVSALMLKMYGLNNVGFHMGESGTTADFDGAVSDGRIADLELEANRQVRRNMKVTVSYPDKEALETLEYRSKLDLDSGVRIVTVGDLDKCACCAPHVPYTGMIGAIRISDCKSYKGGVRLSLECGGDAIRSYRREQNELHKVAASLSAKSDTAYSNLQKLFDEIKEMKLRSDIYSDRINELICSSFPQDTEKPIFLTDTRSDRVALRRLSLALTEKTGEAVCILGTGGILVITAKNGVKDKFRAFAAETGCRGGGSDTLADGSVPDGVDTETLKSCFLNLFA